MQFNLCNYKEKRNDKSKDREKRAAFLHAWIRRAGGGGGGVQAKLTEKSSDKKFLFCFWCSTDFTLSGSNGLFQG